MKIKRRYYVYSFIIIFLISYYYVDREFFMKERVMQHYLWEFEDETRLPNRGDFISTKYLYFKKDTMIFDYKNYKNDTLILKWEYFGTMKILDPRTGKTAKLEMKGANWMNYFFK